MQSGSRTSQIGLPIRSQYQWHDQNEVVYRATTLPPTSVVNARLCSKTYETYIRCIYFRALSRPFKERLRPDFACGAHSASLDPTAGEIKTHCLLLKNTTPILALGFDFWPFGP